MRQPSLALRSLVGADPDLVARSPLLHTEAVTPAGRRLLALVEPLEPRGEARPVAERALAALREAFASAQGGAPDALRAAFASANEAVRAASTAAGGTRHERRVYLGATVIAIDGDRMLLAQAAPTQALVIQEGRLYAFPELASWRPDYVAGPEDAPLEPLGLTARVRPRLYATAAVPGDLVVLCSSAMGQALGRLAAEPDALPSIWPGDPDLVLSELGALAEAFELDFAEVVCAAIGEPAEVAAPALQEPAPVPASPDPRVLDQVAVAWPMARPAHLSGTAGRQRARLGALGIPMEDDPPVRRHEAAGGHQETPPAEIALDGETRMNGRAPDASDERERPVDPPSQGVEPAGGVERRAARGSLLDRLQVAMVDASERLLADHHPVAGGPGRPVLAAPGVGSIRCYRHRRVSPLPPAVRAWLPRFGGLPFSGRLVALGCLLAMLAAGGVTGYQRLEERRTRAAAYLSAADARLLAASGLTDPTALATELSLAQEALDGADRFGAAGEHVAGRQAAIDRGWDGVRGVRRLVDITRVGALPIEANETRPRLVRVGRELFLLGGAVLYRVDGDERALSRILAPGMKVGKATVGTLLDVAADDGTVAVSDGSRLFRLSDEGRWSSRRLGQDDREGWRPVACALFEGSFYVLDASQGRILKFAADRLSDAPLDWAERGTRTGLRGALDLAVDGAIYVLGGDGVVRSYYRGEERAALTPAVQPAIERPLALYGDSATTALYLADATGGEGRVVRFDREGTVGAQYLMPRPDEADYVAAAAAAFASLDDFVIDEALGVVYFVSDGELWRASLGEVGTLARR